MKLIDSIPIDRIEKIGIHCNTRTNQLNMRAVQQKYDADYVMNLGFYNGATYLPVMALKVDNEWQVKENNLEGISFDENGISFGRADDCLYKNFVSGYPTLIRGGEIDNFITPSDLTGHRGRGGIGIDANHDIILGSIEDIYGFQDYTLEEFADDMYAHGARAFINTDGGGSAQSIFPNGTIDSSCNRIVQNYLYIKLKKPLYKLQLGAFRYREGAEYFKQICTNALVKEGVQTTPFVQTYYQ